MGVEPLLLLVFFLLAVLFQAAALRVARRDRRPVSTPPSGKVLQGFHAPLSRPRGVSLPASAPPPPTAARAEVPRRRRTPRLDRSAARRGIILMTLLGPPGGSVDSSTTRE